MASQYGQNILQSMGNYRQEEILRQEREKANQANLVSALTGLISGAASSGQLMKPEGGINWEALKSPSALTGALTGATQPVAGGMKDVFTGGLAGVQSARDIKKLQQEQAKSALETQESTRKPYETVLKELPQNKKLGYIKKYQKELGLSEADLSDLMSSSGEMAPSRPAKPGFYWKATESFDKDGNKSASYVETKIGEGTSERDPLYKILSANDESAADAMSSIPDQIAGVRQLVEKLPKDYASGVWRKARMISEYTKTPELAELGTAYNLLTSSLLKQFQGSRPSDFDYKIWRMVTGAEAVTPINMIKSLNYIENYAAKDREKKIKRWAKKYELPESEVRNFIGVDNQPSISKENPEATKRITVYKNGQPFNIPESQIDEAIKSGYTRS